MRNEVGCIDLRMLMSTLNWRENCIPHPREENKSTEKGGSDFTTLNNFEVNYQDLIKG